MAGFDGSGAGLGAGGWSGVEELAKASATGCSTGALDGGGLAATLGGPRVLLSIDMNCQRATAALPRVEGGKATPALKVLVARAASVTATKKYFLPSLGMKYMPHMSLPTQKVLSS